MSILYLNKNNLNLLICFSRQIRKGTIPSPITYLPNIFLIIITYNNTHNKRESQAFSLIFLILICEHTPKTFYKGCDNTTTNYSSPHSSRFSKLCVLFCFFVCVSLHQQQKAHTQRNKNMCFLRVCFFLCVCFPRRTLALKEIPFFKRGCPRGRGGPSPYDRILTMGLFPTSNRRSPPQGP